MRTHLWMSRIQGCFEIRAYSIMIFADARDLLAESNNSVMGFASGLINSRSTNWQLFDARILAFIVISAFVCVCTNFFAILHASDNTTVKLRR